MADGPFPFSTLRPLRAAGSLNWSRGLGPRSFGLCAKIARTARWTFGRSEALNRAGRWAGSSCQDGATLARAHNMTVSSYHSMN